MCIAYHQMTLIFGYVVGFEKVLLGITPLSRVGIILSTSNVHVSLLDQL